MARKGTRKQPKGSKKRSGRTRFKKGLKRYGRKTGRWVKKQAKVLFKAGEVEGMRVLSDVEDVAIAAGTAYMLGLPIGI